MFLWNSCHLFPKLFYECNTSINDSFQFGGFFLLGIISWKGASFFDGGKASFESRHFYSCLPPSPLKTLRKFLSSYPKQKEITHSLKKHFFKNLFPPTVKRGRRNYDLVYLNSIKNIKMTWNMVQFIFTVL